jgi:hypothetical protein
MGEETDGQNQEQGSQKDQHTPDYAPAVPSTDNQQAERAKSSIDVQTAVMVVVFALVLVAAAGGSVWYAMNKQVTDLQSKNAELTKSITALKKASSPSSTVASSSKPTMYQVEGFKNASWLQSKSIDPDGSDSLLSNTAINATLTPAVVDIGNYGENYTLYKDSYWVAVGIRSVDSRTTGSKRAIIERDNIRLVDNGNKIPPVVVRENLIAPLETKTIYSFFPVNKTSTSFELWTGDMANPTINKLDFTKGAKLSGYFLIDSGFSATPK